MTCHLPKNAAELVPWWAWLLVGFAGGLLTAAAVGWGCWCRFGRREPPAAGDVEEGRERRRLCFLIRGRASSVEAADVDKAKCCCVLFSRRNQAAAGDDGDAASRCFGIMRRREATGERQQPPRDGEAPASQSWCTRIMGRRTAAAAAAPATGEQRQPPRDDGHANPPSPARAHAANPPPACGRDGVQMASLRITGRDDGDGGRRVVLDDLARGKGKEKEIVEDTWDYTDDTDDSITASSTTRPTPTSPPPPAAYRVTPAAAASSSGSGRARLPTLQEEEDDDEGQIVDVPALPDVPAPAEDGEDHTADPEEKNGGTPPPQPTKEPGSSSATVNVLAGNDAPPPATTSDDDAPAQASESAATSCSGGPGVHD
ncbi:hypothetical protein EJB05_26970, partial [Eragrostis curvula]